MSLEGTMIIVDNSDWSRNGDYIPSRWEAQQDAVALIANAKFQAHAESSVGLMTMAGKQVEVLATPINDSGKILASLHGIKLSGHIQLSNALQIAHLALKHRLNVNQKQRIIVFIASPIAETQQNLVALAKKLKKNTIAVDIINIGEMDSQHLEKLNQFIENVNNSDNSHLININPGINLLSDSLYGTPIFGSGENAAGGVINQGGSSQVDPNLDPELAMAMRISLEEEKERQRKLKEEDEKKKNEEQKASHEEQGGQMSTPPTKETEKMHIEEETVPLKNEEEMDEEELLKRAKELSLQDPTNVVQEQEKEKPQPKKEEQVFQDENFVKELLNMIPEVDQNNEEIKKAVEMLQKSKEEQKKDDQDKK